MSLITIIAPIFILIGLGWVARRFSLVPESSVDILTGFVYYIALPALIIQSLALTHWDSTAIFALTVTTLFLLLVCGALFALLSLVVKDVHVRASLFLIAIIGNAVYMGYPVMAGFFGHPTEGLVAALAVIQLVIGILAGLVAMEYWVNKSSSAATCAQYIARNPLFLSVAVGVVLSAVPTLFSMSLIAKPFSMLAGTASPIALFALGSFMYAKFNRSHLGLVLGASVFKVLILPAAAFMVLRAVGLSGEALSAATILSGMPVAITAFVFAQRSKLKGSLVGSAIIVSTIMSFVTLPILLSSLN